MLLLLDDKYAPITSEIGFLQCDSETASQAFMDWQTEIQGKRGVHLERSVVQGKLEKVLLNLSPLTSVERRRFLFVPTEGDWTAYFDNGWRGSDPASTVSFLSEKIGCLGLRVVHIPHSLDSDSGRGEGRYGAVILEVYSPNRTDFINTLRSIYVAYDGGKWVFGETGIPQPMEDLSKYRCRKVQDRFTPEMLDSYLKWFGINAFSEDFYCVKKGTFLIEKKGPFANAMKEYSLDEARANF